MEKINVAGVTLHGYAQGGWQTSVYCPEVRAVFDAGCVLRGVNVDRYLITHSHPDHIMALPYIVGRRSVSEKEEVMHIHAPVQIEDTLRQVVEGMCRLFGDRTPRDKVQIHGHKPGDEIRLGPDHVAKVLPTPHRGPSIGYVVEQRTQRLKPEFKGVEGREIGRLRAQGVEVTEPYSLPMLAVPGDTMIEFLSENEIVQKCKVLLHEVTVWDEGMNNVSGCRRYGHTHVAEMVEHCEKFQGEALVLCHRSMRYSREDIERIRKERFPAHMLDRIHLFDGGDR